MTPYFYVIVPDEIPDLTGPKMAAQATHAQAKVSKAGLVFGDDRQKALYAEWEKQGSNFGTAIILIYRGNFGSLREEMENAYKQHPIVSNDIYTEVLDPTYPIMNTMGRIYTESRETCIGVLVDKDEDLLINRFLRTLDLYPQDKNIR